MSPCVPVLFKRESVCEIVQEQPDGVGCNVAAWQ